MHAVVVSLHDATQVDALFPRLQQAFGQVACYQRGQRLLGGPVHMGEGLVRRQHPGYLLQKAAALLLMVSGSSLFDTMDDVLGMVARMDSPSGVEVEVLDLTGPSRRSQLGSAGS
jgi:hypothetical protein